MTESRVYLQNRTTKELVEASLLDEVTDQHLAMWEKTWKPVMKENGPGHALQNEAEDSHWDWRKKAEDWRPYLNYHSFAIVCQKELQGLMVVSDIHSARHSTQFGKPIVYVEFLATAPWNRGGSRRRKQYRGVGTVMIAAAVELSCDLGYKGRIGLHSLTDSEPFYKKTCGMTQLGRDAAHEDLMYFEMTEKQADAFRGKPEDI
jgi:hypothetical protein